jgi:dTDP-4-dehydrorhamnose 3,5-epimerase
MRFKELEIPGAYVVSLEEKTDGRGFFARTFCAREFASQGLQTNFVQCNVSYNYTKGTLRGMHYQTVPAGEAKLIRCINGAVHYVLIDMRPGSPTYLLHTELELKAAERLQLYVPEMLAIGYQTLTDDSEVIYQLGEFYTPEYECGLRHDDPAFGIEWPLPVTEISRKDASWPLFESIPTGV